MFSEDMKYSASHMENNTFMMPLCHFLRLEWFNNLFYRSKKEIRVWQHMWESK